MATLEELANEAFYENFGEKPPMSTGAVPGIDWLNAGSSLLGSMMGGGPTSSATAVGAPVSVNNSGFSVTNKGNATAEGGEQSTDATTAGAAPSVPWYVWAAGALLAYAAIRRM